MKTNRRSTTLPSPIKTGLQKSTISPSLRYSDGSIGGGDNGSGNSSLNNNNNGSSSVNGGKEDTDERLLKVLDNKNKHINSAVKFQIHSFEMFEKYGEHFKNHIRDAAGDCITLSKLYSVYNDTLTNDSEPLIALASKRKKSSSHTYTHTLIHSKKKIRNHRLTICYYCYCCCCCLYSSFNLTLFE